MDWDHVAPNDALEFSVLLEVDARMRKRERDMGYQKLVFGSVGEEDGIVELFVGDGKHEMWQHRTLYCIREKQDEEKHQNRVWTDWRAPALNSPANAGELREGRVAVVARTRDWMPKEPKYKLKQRSSEDKEGWREFSVSEANQHEHVDARNVRVKFQKRIMNLQEVIDILGSGK
jgi:hypothetical protein